MKMKHSWSNGIQRLENYLAFTEELLELAKEKNNAKSNFFPYQKYTDDEQYEIASGFASEEWHIDEHIATFYYQALFLSIYAWFEYQVLCVCRKDDLESKRDLFDRLKNYLRNSGKQKLIDSSWNTILVLKSIRNLIVHNGSSLDMDSKAREAVDIFVKNHADKIAFGGPAYAFGEKGSNYPREIVVRKRFCDYALSIIKNFLIQMSDMQRN